MKKILHIMTDANENIFMDFALDTFENVFPGQNTVWLIVNRSNARSKCHRDLEFKFIETLRLSFLNKLTSFDLILIHGLDFLKYPMIAFAPKGVKFAWIGWGFDYYGFIYKNTESLVFTETQNLKNGLESNSRWNVYTPVKLIKHTVRKALEFSLQKKVLRRIGSFSPVLPEEYSLLSNSNLIAHLPPLVPWNYGSLEENLVNNFIDYRVDGNNVLVGNSASFTNNHLEVFRILSDSRVKMAKNAKVIVPLSYGDEAYGQKIIEKGVENFGNNFEPLLNFMPIDEYIEIIKQCGFVIMNFKRQQALGNILIMLYFGARVFFAAENPIYQMLKKEGVICNLLSDIQSQPDLITKALSEEEVQINIRFLKRHWSKEAINNKTQNLVDFHCGADLER